MGDLRCAAARDLAMSLRTMVEGDPPALQTFLPRLQRLLRAEKVAAFGLTPPPIALRFAYGSASLLAEGRPALEAVLRSHPRDFGAFDPVCPEPRQRNAVLLRQDLASFVDLEALPVVREVFPAAGLTGLDILRALVCDGTEMLAWVGAFRRTPFSEGERQLVRRVLPALRHRLGVERDLARAPIAAAALAGALEAVGDPAFLLRDHGHVVQANAAAQALLDRDTCAVTAELRAAVAGRGDPRFTVTGLSASGAPGHYLALLRPAPRTPTPRAATAAVRWALTTRQREVLTLLAVGKCNKTIAAQLGCAQRTVELHVSALLEKARCDQRAELVKKFWTEI